MMTRMRQLTLRKNQKGLAIVEYVIVLAVVAALAFAVFGGDDGGLTKDLQDRANNAKNTIKSIPDPNS